MKAPGVGCGAAVLENGRLPLVKRKRPPEAGCWNLPGGKVDFGETVGLDIELTERLAVVERIGIDDQHWIAPTYLARVLGGQARNLEPERPRRSSRRSSTPRRRRWRG